MTTTPEPRPGRRRAKRWIAGGVAVISAGAVLAGPVYAFAQDDGDNWLSDALQTLVDDGTLTTAQADAVEQAIADARPERGPGGGWGGRGGPWRHGGGLLALDEAADAIGIGADALRDALRDGQTIAEVAAANDVDVQVVIDAILAEVQARLDEAVADGRIDATESAERLTDATERITELVNEGFPARPDFADGPGHWPGRDDDESTSTTEPGS